jgi:hypothetical protein
MSIASLKSSQNEQHFSTARPYRGSDAKVCDGTSFRTDVVLRDNFIRLHTAYQ